MPGREPIPCGGPLPQVHDIWRAGAPDMDILAPDLYLPYFDEVCERFSRNGNPLFIPETGTNASNVIMAIGKYNAIGFSPFGIDGNRPMPADLRRLPNAFPDVADDTGPPGYRRHDGRPDGQGEPPKKVSLGDYTLTFRYTGRIQGLPPQERFGVVAPNYAPPAPSAEPLPRWKPAQSSFPQAPTSIISAEADARRFCAEHPRTRQRGPRRRAGGTVCRRKAEVTRQLAEMTMPRGRSSCSIPARSCG